MAKESLVNGFFHVNKGDNGLIQAQWLTRITQMANIFK